MKSTMLVFLVFALAIITVECNTEGDILNLWKIQLIDPDNALLSWDPTLVNPCTWFHVTCSSANSVTRLDLGNANLTGPLIPQLANLSNLQYFELLQNNLSGSIPKEMGNLKKLVSLDLYSNQLSGSIPASIGNLKSLRFLRLHNNKLSGKIPISVIQLVFLGDLEIVNFSNNQLKGTYRKVVNTTIFRDAHW